MSGEDDITLILPFGPTRPVPDGYHWCFACDGSGKSSSGEGQCEVCQGKGHWNKEDIRIYHERHPELCRKTCGSHHLEPWIPSSREKLT